LEYFEFIVYGLIQGLTEFIPVSSTAHLKVISIFLGINDPGPSISAIIQLGSVFAVFWYFRKEFFLSSNQSSKKLFNILLNSKLSRSIFIGSIPIIFLGGIIKLYVSNFSDMTLRSNLSIGIVSIFMALYMYLSDNSKKSSINIKNHKYFDSFLIGFSQAFAIFPGVSRSGVTISTALLTGWNRKDAAKFSFLLGIPAITLAAIVEFVSSFNEFTFSNLPPLIFGLATAFLSSLLAIDFLIRYLTSNGMKLFIFYRVIFGIVILLNL